jgi:hypothetical protein
MDTPTELGTLARESHAHGPCASPHRGEPEVNPCSGVPGEADPGLNEIARALLAGGNLAPIRGDVTWAGHGSGGTCCVCGKAVKSSEVQYEVEDEGRRSIGCHFPCFIAWQEESRRNRAVGRTPSGLPSQG